MGASVGYLVPYELRARGTDIASGKPVSNIFYYRSGIQTVAPPAYGASVVGPSDLTTVLANFATKYQATILQNLPDKYVLSQYELRSIIGWKWGKPTWPVLALGVGAVTVINTVATVTFPSGTLVKVSNVTGATNANGLFVATVLSPTAFSIPANTSAQTWTGGGLWQEATGAPQWVYGDVEVLASTDTGIVATEAVALFATASVRRLSGSQGKSFQGRNSFSPIPEADVASGGFTTAAKTAWGIKLAAFNSAVANGGSDVPGSGNMYLFNVSKKIASSLPTPFTSSFPFCVSATLLTLRPDMGTMLRRKPKLGQVITP